VNSRSETTAFFPAGREQLFGIITSSGTSNGTAVVAVAGGGHHTSAHLARLSVRLCRRAAERGYPALRFDYHGVGESTGDLSEYRFSSPFVEDLAAALRWARAEGMTRFVPVGLCFGARTALAAAASDPEIVGIVPVSLPLGDLRQGEGTPARRTEQMGPWRLLASGLRPQVLRGFFRARSFRRQVRTAATHLRVAARTLGRRVRPGAADRDSNESGVSPGLVRDLAALATRGVPMLFVYGEEDPFYRQFLQASERELAPILRHAGSLMRVLTVPEAVRPYENVSGQERMLEGIDGWLAEHFGTLSQQAAPAGAP
jgi:pimeloyl-ACP methyl ester carboxylesterase